MGISVTASQAAVAAVVARRGVHARIRIAGREDELVGQVVRGLSAGSIAFWPIAWEEPIVLRLVQIDAAFVVDMNRADLEQLRAKQRGGTL